MVQSSLFKTQIVLKDYFYQKDIEHRMLISELTPFEIEVLREILHDSLRIPVADLAENLEVEIEKLTAVLIPLQRTKLFRCEGKTLFVDKEVRKYYEIQMEKFSPGFRPNLEFIQNMLNSVPLNVLLLWYTIPRTSNNIFSSIVQECLLTPKIYRQYLSELHFKDPVLHAIIKDLYAAPNFKLFSQAIIEKYHLTREEFEEHILLLEYHFVCCLKYELVGDKWQEVVTPFAEWHEYLQTEIKLQTHPLKESDHVTPFCENEFGFIEDLTTIIHTVQKDKIPLQQITGLSLNQPFDLKEFERKLIQLEFVKQNEGYLIPTNKGLIWAKKSLQDRITSLAVDSKNFISGFEKSDLWNLRTIHAIEKSLRHLKVGKWVYLNDFLNNISINIGNTQPTTLQKKGKKWKYVLPEYTPAELNFIKKVIIERCFELGLIMNGLHDDKPCFYLTKFGSHFIY